MTEKNPILQNANTKNLNVLTWNVGRSKNNSWKWKEFQEILGCKNISKTQGYYDIIFLQEVPIKCKDDTEIQLSKFGNNSFTSRYYSIITSNQVIREAGNSKYVFITLIKKDAFSNNVSFHVSEIRNKTGNGNDYHSRALIVMPARKASSGGEIPEGPVLVNVHLQSNRMTHKEKEALKKAADIDQKQDEILEYKKKLREIQAQCIGSFTRHFKSVILAGDFNCETPEAMELGKIISPKSKILKNNSKFTYKYSEGKGKNPCHHFDWIVYSVNIGNNSAKTIDVRKDSKRIEKSDIGLHYPVKSISELK